MQGNGQVLHNPEVEKKVELPIPNEAQRFQSHLQLQLSQISHPVPEPVHNNIAKFQNTFSERDFDFVSINSSCISFNLISNFIIIIIHFIAA